jgi:hypothetical protein
MRENCGTETTCPATAKERICWAQVAQPLARQSSDAHSSRQRNALVDSRSTVIRCEEQAGTSSAPKSCCVSDQDKDCRVCGVMQTCMHAVCALPAQTRTGIPTGAMKVPSVALSPCVCEGSISVGITYWHYGLWGDQCGGHGLPPGQSCCVLLWQVCQLHSKFTGRGSRSNRANAFLLSPTGQFFKIVPQTAHTLVYSLLLRVHNLLDTNSYHAAHSSVG